MWINKPTKFVLEVRNLHEKNTRKIASYAAAEIATTSPVAIGRYRANHNVTVGAPNFSFNKHKTGGTMKIPAAKGSQNYYIANGAPYAGALEHGHSQFAPLGIYGVARQSTFAKFW